MGVLMLREMSLVQASTVRPVARDEERNRDTILTPSFAKRSSAQNSFILAEGELSQNDMADQRAHQMSEFHFRKFAIPSTFSYWNIRFKTEVCSCSNFLAEAVLCGDGRYSRRSEIFVFFTRVPSFPRF